RRLPGPAASGTRTASAPTSRPRARAPASRGTSPRERGSYTGPPTGSGCCAFTEPARSLYADRGMAYGPRMSDDLAWLDASAQAELVRRGKASSAELVEAAILRIERTNPELNAVIIPRFEEARAEAASRALPDGPFRGVPFLLKDLICYSAGDPHHMGTRFLRDLGFVAPADTYLAEKSRAARYRGHPRRDRGTDARRPLHGAATRSPVRGRGERGRREAARRPLHPPAGRAVRLAPGHGGGRRRGRASPHVARPHGRGLASRG